MVYSTKKLGALSVSLCCFALLGQIEQAKAECETGVAPQVYIDAPAPNSNTDASEITVQGHIDEECSLSDVSASVYVSNSYTGTTRGATVSTDFDDNQARWWFEIKGVELQPADGPGESVENTIEVTALDGARNSGSATLLVTHALPAAPPPSEGPLLGTRNEKGKVTFFYNTTDQQQDRFSAIAWLTLPPNFKMPCGVWEFPEERNRGAHLVHHYLSLELLAEDPDTGNFISLWSDKVDSENVNTCRDVRYREPGPKPGLRDLDMELRSDNSVTFYTFAEGLEFLRSKEEELGSAFPEYIRKVPNYVLRVIIDESEDPAVGETWEWQIVFGPNSELSYEEYSTRTVIRYNR